MKFNFLKEFRKYLDMEKIKSKMYKLSDKEMFELNNVVNVSVSWLFRDIKKKYSEYKYMTEYKSTPELAWFENEPFDERQLLGIENVKKELGLFILKQLLLDDSVMIAYGFNTDGIFEQILDKYSLSYLVDFFPKRSKQNITKKCVWIKENGSSDTYLLFDVDRVDSHYDINISTGLEHISNIDFVAMLSGQISENYNRKRTRV